MPSAWLPPFVTTRKTRRMQHGGCCATLTLSLARSLQEVLCTVLKLDALRVYNIHIYNTSTIRRVQPEHKTRTDV